MKDKIFDKLKEELPEIRKGVLLKDYTTFKIGGPAKYFFVAKSEEDLISSAGLAKKTKLPIFILGGGSNILVSDKGLKGLTVKIGIENCEAKGNKIFASAGMALSKLAKFSAENGYTGFEWAGGIPRATVGGAIYGHAQAFGSKISDYIESVKAFNLKTLKIKTITKKQCRFSLKSSIFKKDKNLIIISAVFCLEKGDKKKIKEKTKELLNYRKNNHPLALPSAGSTFVNPEKKGEIIRAGYLIEKAGLKGKRIGNAEISKQHANFIVNLGNAKARDVAALIKLAQKKVEKTSGISLEAEVRFIGF